jgi:hypothetical protein
LTTDASYDYWFKPHRNEDLYEAPKFLKNTALTAAALGASPLFSLASSQKKPNVIVILTEDIGHGGEESFGLLHGSLAPGNDVLDDATEAKWETIFYLPGYECSAPALLASTKVRKPV